MSVRFATEVRLVVVTSTLVLARPWGSRRAFRAAGALLLLVSLGASTAGCAVARKAGAGPAEAPQPETADAAGYGQGGKEAEIPATPAPAAATAYHQDWATPPPPFDRSGPWTPTSLAEAEQAMALAEQWLDRSLDVARARAEQLSTPGTPGADACAPVCSALASLRRSAEGICRLAGSSDARCERAQATLSRNEQRVADSGCACSGS